MQELVNEKTGQRKYRHKYIFPYRNEKGRRRVFAVITDPQREYELGWTAVPTSNIRDIRKGVKALWPRD